MTDTDWKARAEAAEARVKELEAYMHLPGMDATILGRIIYDERGVAWRDRALYLQDRAEKLESELIAALEARRIVTDEMVERAASAIDPHAFQKATHEERMSNEPSRRDYWRCVMRAALTAALGTRHD